MPWIAPLIGTGLSALSGFLGGGKQQENKTTGTSNTNTSQTGSQQGTFSNAGGSTYNQFGSSTPNLSPFQQQLAQMFTGGAQKLWNQSTDMSGYKAAGLGDINRNSNNFATNLSAKLANRGLAYSPAAATAMTQGEMGRIGEVNKFEQSIPLLQRQMQQQALGGLMQAFQVQPYGTTTTGGGTTATNQSGSQNVNSQQSGTSSGTTTGNSQQFGNPWAGLAGGGGAGFMASLPMLMKALQGGGGGFGGLGTIDNIPGV